MGQAAPGSQGRALTVDARRAERSHRSRLAELRFISGLHVPRCSLFLNCAFSVAFFAGSQAAWAGGAAHPPGPCSHLQWIWLGVAQREPPAAHPLSCKQRSSPLVSMREDAGKGRGQPRSCPGGPGVAPSPSSARVYSPVTEATGEVTQVSPDPHFSAQALWCSYW